jgi:TonB family protein
MRYLLIATFLVVSTARADWQQVGATDTTGQSLYLDAARITELKEVRRAWVKSLFASDQPMSDDERIAVPDAQTFRWVSTMRYFLCAQRSSAIAQFYWHGADDKLLGNRSRQTLNFTAVSPGSVEEQLLETVCRAEAAPLQLPAGVDARLSRLVNPDDFYPSGSQRRGESGSPVVQVCVGPNGKMLREPLVTDSSGFPDLDGASIKAAKAAGYLAAKENGTALPESCIRYKIKFLPKPG